MAETARQESKAEEETMADIVTKTRPVYDGHPANAEEESSVGEGPSEEEEEPTGSEEPQEEEEEEEPPRFKYKTHEEAEKGYREAERLATERAEEAGRERERSERLQRQLSDLNASLSKLTPAKEEKEPSSTLSDFTQTQLADVFDRIGRLDPEDPEYTKKWAAVYSEFYSELNARQQAEIDKRFEKYDADRREEQRALDAEELVQESVVETATDVAEKAGLDMSEDSDDFFMFWTFCDRAPEGSIEEQAQWTCDRISEIKKGIKEPILKSKRKARETQERNEVLDRGGEGPHKKEEGPPARPMTLSEAFGKTERRI
jgi:hypothetical protein